MKTIIRSKSLGYCFGVKSAVLKAEELLNKNQELYALGSLIHNKIELGRLQNLGLKTLEEGIDPPSGSFALIRAHGISPQYRRQLQDKNIKLIDATCPLVVKNQKLASGKNDQLYHVIIVGKKSHAEIKALLGFIDNNNVTIINSIEEASDIEISHYNKIVLIAQTTFEPAVFKQIVEILKTKNSQIECPTSICSATTERQEALLVIADQCEAIVIVGDSHSSNTMGLVNRAKSLNKPTFLVEDINSIDSQLKNYDIIGLTAGASAPNYLIDAIEDKLQLL